MAFKCLIAAVVFLLPQLNPPVQSPSANDLVRQIVGNEVRMQEQDRSRWMYRLQIETGGVEETKEVVETKDGDLTRLLARNGQALSDEQQKEEDDRMRRGACLP
jgi:hypothetical protein